jgi:PAS domain S-box-containing protein/diguanylate cyclase (GGDEF)-like protein
MFIFHTLVNRIYSNTSKDIHIGFISFCILVIYASLLFALIKNKKLHDEREKRIEAERRLNESETIFRAVFEQANIGIAIAYNDDCIISKGENRPSMNKTFECITGRSKEEFSKVGWMDITHPEDLQEDLKKFTQLNSGEIDSYNMEKRYIKPDGSIVWVRMIISKLFLENSTGFHHLCFVEDISKQKEIEKELYKSERSKAVILENLPGMAYRCNYDREWTMRYVSRGCSDLTGYRPESLLQNRDLSYNQLIMPKYQEFVWTKWRTALSEGSKFKEEYEIITASGEIKWVFEQGQGVYNEINEIEELEGFIIDISQRKEQEMKFKYDSEHDKLTGLYNRRYFETSLYSEIHSNKLESKALLLVNIRNFNNINITYGYFYGEKLIVEMAKLLTDLCMENKQLFHISIDRFAIVMKYQNHIEISDFCETIFHHIQNIQTINNVQVSIGIVDLQNCDISVDNILKFASIAAEEADKNQEMQYCFFNQEMEERIMHREKIKEELSIAAINDEDENFYMVYQPIIDLKTDKIYGFEALARFKSEKLGWVSPAEFIPIAEETGIIISLGKRIMRQAFHFLKTLELLGFDSILLSFNVSAIQLLREDFIDTLHELMTESGIHPRNLNIELTESVFLNDYNEINKILNHIKELNINISIDDFGTGYSSLAREGELDIDCLKIDKYFIDKLLTLNFDEALTGDIISMAHKLGHCVVAEGVEHERQKQYLIEHNCDYMQGYLFSKPISSELAIKLLGQTNL